MQLKKCSREYWQSSLLMLVMLLGLVSERAEARQPIEALYSTQICNDFLARWDQKPATVKFVRCETVKHEQVDRQVSFYRVKGSDAIAIEKFLQKRFGMAPLRFACCLWEPDTAKVAPPYGKYVDNKGAQFEIWMSSGETVVGDRQDWHQIPEFHIRVITYLGEV